MNILSLLEVTITVSSRQRTSIEAGPLNELIESIAVRGLIHPPTLYHVGGKEYLLIAGERRFEAIKKLHKEGRTFFCDARPILKDELPYLLTDVASLLDQRQLEFDENAIREPLSWQDRTRALADIHSLKVKANPAQTVRDTAQELIEAGGGGLTEAKSDGHVRRQISEASTIAEHLNDPTIAKARNSNEAYALILKKTEEQALAALSRQRIKALPKSESARLTVRRGDLLQILPALDAGFVDLILADPPYGIEAGSGGFRSRTVHHHNYTDDIDTAKNIARTILSEGFRLTKPRANIFLFTDIKHWDWLQQVSANLGWVPFRTPIIWQKSESEGLAPWGSGGPRRTYEIIFYATKGQKGMLSSPTDIWTVKRVPRKERIHAAEKPVELLRRAIECTTLAGDFILDPCCGSGSSLVAAREANRFGLGIEKDETFYNTAMANVFKGGDGLDPIVEEAASTSLDQS